MTKQSLHRALLLSVIFFTLALPSRGASNDAALSRNADIFNSALKELATFYVDTIDSDKAIETALTAMLGRLDPYTEYIPPADVEDFRVLTTGEYGGLGSYIMEYKGFVYFSEPYEGSPAARAGIHPGDRIIEIDGESMAGKTSEYVSNHLKGMPGSVIDLKVVRPYCGDDSVKTFIITRETIKMEAVTYYGVIGTDGRTGYIKLETFNEHCGQQVRDALIDLRDNHHITSLIIDLRGNTGGLVDGAVQVLSLFLPKGTQVLQTHGRDKSSEKTYKTLQQPVDTKLPLVVLIDGNSASASEIVAGALQDLDRAVIVGTRSFGKGLVQTTRPLPYDGLLKVTIAKYYIPSGRLIQEIDYSQDPDKKKEATDTLGNIFHTAAGREVRDGGGITPDIKIDYPEVSRLVYNIVRDNWAFNYSTLYASQHPTLDPPEKFAVTDEIFYDFKHFIDPEKFDYDKVCETGLESLRKVATTEGYMNDETKAQFDRLADLLKHDLDHDLDIHRPEIESILAQEIIKHYYYQRGQTVYDLYHDDAVKRAVEVLGDDKAYRAVLTPKKSAK